MSFLDLSGPYKLNNPLASLDAVELEQLDDINQALQNPYGSGSQTVDELLNFFRASIPLLNDAAQKAQYQDMVTRGSLMTKNGLVATHPTKYHELPGWGISHGTRPAAGTVGAAYWSVIRLPLQFVLQAMLTAYQDRGELKFFERSATICASLVEFVEVICKERVNCAKLALGVAVVRANSESYSVAQELTSAAQLLAKECEKTSSQIKRIPEVNSFLGGLKRTHNSVKISSELVSGAGISAGGSGVSISNDFAGQAMTILSEGFEEYNATGSVSRTIGKVAGSFRR